MDWHSATDIKYALEHNDPRYCIDLREFREVVRCADDILP